MAEAKPHIENFMKHVTIAENGCWLWTASAVNGYGDFRVNGRTMRAHIFSFLYHKGDYDRRLDLDHTCHNGSGCLGGKKCEHRRCVNPYHLEPVTRKENANRGEVGQYLARRTHCKNGHEYTKENTQFGANGRRRCVECRRAEFVRFKERNPEKYRANYKRANSVRLAKSKQNG